MNRFITITEYPAYDVVSFHSQAGNKVFDGEYLYCAANHTSWKLGSVVGFALEGGRDPIADYNDAVKAGHETHYAFGVGASISSNPQKLDRRIAIEYGDVITFHGQEFIIQKAANYNIKLVPVA